MSEQDSQARRINSKVTGMWETVSESTMLRRSIVTVEGQNTANVNGPSRGSRMAVADIDTVAAAVQIGTDRGVGG